MKNPANLAKHQANPKVAPIIAKMMSKFGGPKWSPGKNKNDLVCLEGVSVDLRDWIWCDSLSKS